LRIWGVDFTSAPRKAKPISVARSWLDGSHLSVEAIEALPDFTGFEALLARPGPWVAGFDFPFTQSQRFLKGVGWPLDWGPCVDFVARMSRDEFRERLEKYKHHRPFGDKEHQRVFEKGTGAASPQKLYGVPVGLMFYEGAQRLRRAGVHVPGLCLGDPDRIAVEAYPGVAARALVGRASYKSDQRDTAQRLDARKAIVAALTGQMGRERFGLSVTVPEDIAVAASGDALDAAICAVQAAWALRMGFAVQGMSGLPDPAEGWIADPFVVNCCL
jgi:hypothetical protein